jgi:hypothetical protein
MPECACVSHRANQKYAEFDTQPATIVSLEGRLSEIRTGRF